MASPGGKLTSLLVNSRNDADLYAYILAFCSIDRAYTIFLRWKRHCDILTFDTVFMSYEGKWNNNLGMDKAPSNIPF